MPEDVRVYLTKEVIDEIERKTGALMMDLNGALAMVAENNELVFRPVLDESGKVRDAVFLGEGSSKCSGSGDNKYVGQSGCANDINAC